MVLMIAGIAMLIATAVVFRAFMPRGGETHRFVGTEWEPYVGVAFCSAVALGFTMLLAGGLSMTGTQ
jgi:hypothetical protein